MACVDWQQGDGATADESGWTVRDAGRDGGVRGELLAGGGGDSHLGDVDGEEGQRWSWAAHLAEHGDETGTGTRREPAARARKRTRARATVWWQVQGGAPPDSNSDHLQYAEERGRGDVRGEGNGEWVGMLWAGGLLGIVWGSVDSISHKVRLGGIGREGGWRREGRDWKRGADRLLDRWARMWATLLVLMTRVHACVANEDETKERMMLFNTRGLAVSTSTVAVAAGAGYFFARAALDKLAFIATTLSTKGIEAGVCCWN